MVSLTEGIASYEFEGLDFLMQIGDIELNFDSLSIQIGTTDGAGVIWFVARDETLGIFTIVQFQGTAPVSTDLPTILDLAQFNWANRFVLYSDQNPEWPPLVSGPIYNANIIPAPGAMGMVIGGVGFFSRRRR